MPGQVKDRSAAPRLVAVARDLFVRRGSSVGINEVIATAGVARRSLYNNFESKTALAREAFEAEAADRRAAIEAAQAGRNEPRARILALFDLVEALATRDGFRGCAFINLAVETANPDSELHVLAKRHKDWIRERIEIDLRTLGRRPAEANVLAEQIRVLWDGCITGAYIHGSPVPIRAAKAAAEALLHV